VKFGNECESGSQSRVIDPSQKQGL